MIFKFYFIEVQLIYNVLISVVQQCDSVIYMYMYYTQYYTHTLIYIFFFHIPLHYGYFNTSSICCLRNLGENIKPYLNMWTFEN